MSWRSAGLLAGVAIVWAAPLVAQGIPGSPAHLAGRSGWDALLDALRREAALHGTFFSSHGAHFTVLFEGPSDEVLAARAIEILEAAYWRVSTALSAYPEGVTTVVLY